MGKSHTLYPSKAIWKVPEYEYVKKFFDINGNKEIFKHLKIAQETRLCEEYMGKYPVISVSLKGINAQTYEKAIEMTVQLIKGEARRFQYLLESSRLTEYDKKHIRHYLKRMWMREHYAAV